MNSQLIKNTPQPKSDSSSENESIETAGSVSRLEAIKSNKAQYADDELILSLQNHRENRRARQVFEWETTRRSGGNGSGEARQFLRDAAWEFCSR